MGNTPEYSFRNTQLVDNKNTIALENGEIYDCGQACGNGWRKVFNVYAKLVFALPSPLLRNKNEHTRWQDYRDDCLLQKNSNTALIFGPPEQLKTDCLQLIIGKTYANELIDDGFLGNDDHIKWISNEFALSSVLPLIICPYFDYRQLSNAKIIYLVALINAQIKAHTLHTSYASAQR
jgi:hypothetical protein